MTSGWRWRVSYVALIVSNPLKSNWHLAASCQLPIHKNVRIGIWLPFADFLLSFNPYHLISNWHLAACCQLPIYKNVRIGIWLPFADFLFT